MKISFYIGNTFYHGTAVPFEKTDTAGTQFVVRFEDKELPVFHVCMSGKGEWISDDMQSADLVSAVGSEIEKRDDEKVLNIEPGHYTSSGEVPNVTTIDETVVKNGEIINELEDVDEHAFDKK